MKQANLKLLSTHERELLESMGRVKLRFPDGMQDSYGIQARLRQLAAT